MSNHYKGLVEFLTGYFQKSQYIAAGPAVKIAGRFISQNDSGLGNQSAGDSDTLLLAAGKVIWQIVQLIFQCQHPHHLTHKFLVYLIAVQFHRQHDILVDI